MWEAIFSMVTFDVGQCRALAVGMNENMELVLDGCRLEDGGASLVDAFRDNQGPSRFSAPRMSLSLEQFCRFSDALGQGHPENGETRWTTFSSRDPVRDK